MADRWHLLKDLGDALQWMLEVNSASLRATAEAMVPTQSAPDDPASEEATAQAQVDAVPQPSAIKSQLHHQ
ncbi:MAG: hypothetical protein AAGE93_18390 [Bacteroidota bacterium]